MNIDIVKHHKLINDLKAYGYSIESITEYINKMEKDEIHKKRKETIKKLLNIDEEGK